ncbi:hypothetical protein C2W62_34900 [Candidatus Entotheonella serta]|nr:hypothetical protein C2W62_34900 [Candidatus Entotheonella serta]
MDFPNQDTMFHSVYSFSRQQRFEIGLYKPGESRSVTFHKVGAIKLFCNIHDNMFGTVVVLPTPYFSTAIADGDFTISDVPAGSYTVQVWHEQLQGVPQSVSVPTQGMADLSFVLSPKRRLKRSTE